MQHCTTCSADLIAGALFCDACGASQAQVKVARKLRQTSFENIKDAKEGLLSPGERLKGRQYYVIEEAIARSGFGATFRAIRIADESQILIKQMIEQTDYDQFKKQLVESFKREARFLRKIKHPAFPRGYEFFEKNKSIYLVMDFINGKELAKALEEYRTQHKGKVEDGLLIYLGSEIADALEVVHSHGYIYRDLKPQNVMLDGVSSRVKLIDFGTLYHQSDKDPLIFESEGYTPPEFKQKGIKYQPSGDIYSLGALLYEIIMGDTPQPGAKLTNVPNDKRLCQIIEQCLELDPAKRFQRARNVRDELLKLTKKGFWPFKNRNAIAPVELSVLPKTLYPSACTFCEFCGHADANSQAGYCKNCRVPLRVGRLKLKQGKHEREFFLFADETIVGASNQCHFTVTDPNPGKKGEGVNPRHIRIFRRKNGLWLEAVDQDKENTQLNQRKILGPVELRDGDIIHVGSVALKYDLKDAC